MLDRRHLSREREGGDHKRETTQYARHNDNVHRRRHVKQGLLCLVFAAANAKIKL